MSILKIIILLSITCLFVPSIFAETNIESITKHRTGFSLGVDDFPWNASEVSLRWWQDNGKGKELSVERFHFSINKSETLESENSSRTIISFPNITYYLLYRSPSSSF